jgi:cation:H+ antiporter
MMTYIILLVGFVMLIKGADVFVDGSSNIAKRFGIPSIIVGLTIVAMGTSAPELSVSVQSALAGMNDISIGNVVGSNIFNLLVVLGMSSIIGKLKITDYKNVIMMLLSSLILLLCGFNGQLTRLEGIVLLLIFVGYIFNLVLKAIKDNNKTEENENVKPLFITIISSIIGLGAIVWGGDLVVESASAIAQQLGMSQNLIGLTIVAIGTSLPELVTSVVATKKGELDIATGNVIGSNIFNLLLIIGASVAINPMVVSTVAIIDIMFTVAVVILFIILTGKNESLDKVKGIPLILIYVAYIIYTIIR